MIAILVFGYNYKRKDKHGIIFGIFIEMMIAGFVNKYKIIAVFHCLMGDYIEDTEGSNQYTNAIKDLYQYNPVPYEIPMSFISPLSC